MKKLLVFTLISFLFHGLLLLVKLSEPNSEQATVVEIVSREPQEPAPLIGEPLPPTPEATPEVTPPNLEAPDHIIPDTPEPAPSVPVRMDDRPSPNLYEPEPVPEPSYDTPKPDVPETKPLIVPVKPDPDNPPKPYSISEFLEEQDRLDKTIGPDRQAGDIINDWLQTNPMLKPGEDEVSFSNMNAKYDSYFYKFGRSLYGTWEYPPESARKGESGMVRVKFSIMPDGSITNISMISSSGYSALDREVLRTLKNMNTVPLPPSYGLNMLHVNGFFIYSITGEYRLY